jgi:tRNA(Ile)-lysidine synthetase-like protein
VGDRTELAFRRSATRLIPEGAGLLAAVSGGGDSVALLHLVHRWARRRRVRITVAHLDHGMRRGSRADRRFVEGMARELGCACLAERREVPALRRKSESPEEGARRVRRAFLLEAMRAAGADTIATGHTLDDQAETILMRLVRGAGATALTGMAPAGPGPFVRPLLGLERTELRAWLARRGLTYREDPTNSDMRFDRNRVRRLVLPVLAEALNPRAARHLVQAAGRFREDALHLDAAAERALPSCARKRGPGRLAIESSSLASFDPTLGRRVARLALLEAGADPRRIGTRHVEALIDLARGGNGRSAHLASGITAHRKGNLLLLAKNRPE